MKFFKTSGLVSESATDSVHPLVNHSLFKVWLLASLPQQFC